MTPDCQCVRSSDTVLTAARKMAELDVGALPICGEDNKLKGMLTDRDIVVKVVAQRKDPIGIDAGDLADGVPVVAQADDDVERVLQLMADHQVRRLPVIDHNELVGIIAQADIARILEHRASGEVVEAISQE
ncbi:CBS domain-containing protein [Nocardia sp. CDC153]|uniref:CBS domain-containing protein n=1 Tax=Nocardia sp. CDC153 TaxID=3112167 RepID=UPI002DBC8584|nr:CBS domain-containing protein [Nocardia sp. CDC153]MEC3957484.1 CBS domain-containing protein [Nocardia sp. CDC153]